VSFKFDKYFNGIFTVAERSRLFDEQELLADLDFLRGKRAAPSQRIDRDALLYEALYAAAETARRAPTGQVDWRLVVAMLIHPQEPDPSTTATALEMLVEKMAAPGVALVKANE
jgi:hypothetical protein